MVLIDDEPLILEGLRRAVPWQEYGCEVAGTAEDAGQGAELIRERHPHILFTDIRMPGEDGLTMLAGLRSEFPDMLVTVLTGYREFAYAQEAIRLGVFRFLLKPSRMDEIREALSAMTERLGRGSAPVTEAKEPAAGAQEGGPQPETEDPSGEKEMSPEEKEGDRAGSFLVRQALSYMEAHFAEKLTLQEVADACYVSQWHLSKLLNRHTGKSFYDILHSLRIRAARKLLEDPSLRIGDVCERVGYADTAHFARVFKKMVGMSANEYRNSL